VKKEDNHTTDAIGYEGGPYTITTKAHTDDYELITTTSATVYHNILSSNPMEILITPEYIDRLFENEHFIKKLKQFVFKEELEKL
jgi:hypothetical protein